MRNRKWICCLALLMLFLLPVSVSASEDFEDDGVGSLRVLGVRYPVRLHHVFYMNGRFTNDFAGCGLMLELESLEKDAKLLYDYTQEQNIPGKIALPANREASFGPLEEGMYLVSSVHDPAEFAPFLLMIPTELNGDYVYHVEAKPKVEDFPEDPEETDPTTPPPSDPDSTNPTTPPSGETTPAGTHTESNVIFQAGSSEIPQTGNSVIPQYLLMAIGTLLTLAGLYRVVTEKKENTDD